MVLGYALKINRNKASKIQRIMHRVPYKI